ncbi:MAG: hypothetical protein LBG14_05710 [Treponema sp.]|jgi:hypothetical protein|nr:hypothetical protein [Treponema sp.]
MIAYISKKNALIRLGLSLCMAAGAMALVFQLLRGPQLGPHYDYLLQFAAGAPVSGELLLIETRLPRVSGEAAPGDDFVESASIATALLLMTGMNAEALAIQAPVAEAPRSTGLPPLSVNTREDLRLRFDGEFELVERNIRNLFEAIRLGFILPLDAERYVGELVSITLRGKDRLLRALYPPDRGERSPLERAMAVFGRVRAPGGDLYYHALPDWDGKIRRVLPAQGPAEHIVYAALKDRLPPDRDFSRAADDQGALLALPPEGDFRRLPLAALLEHEEADRELYRLLANAESRGIYAGLNPESYPGYLYDHARNLRDELLRDPSGERKTRWLAAQEGYFQSLDAFFNGPSEAALVEGYEKLIASESLDVEGLRRITALRNDLILTFRNLREKYAGLLALRAALREDLSNSFCIMGAPGPELENSAILANTLLAGAWIVPGSDRDTLLLAAAGAFVILAGLCLLGPWVSLGLGLLLTAILGAAFSCSFILRGLWMDPLIPVSAALAGVLSSFAFALLAKRRSAALFRSAYGPRMAKPFLRRLISAGGPLPRETVTVNAALVAVRNRNLSGIENRSGPEESAAAAAAFREEALRLFTRAGAVMTGIEGDLAVFAFGSPLERQALKKMKEARPYDDSDTARFSPGSRAAALVLDIIKNAPGVDAWRFAVDAGQCSFSWSAAAGYTASGRAAITARLLSSLSSRHKTRFVASSRVAMHLEDIPLKKLGALVDQSSGEREDFYGLEPGEPPPPGQPDLSE